MKFLGFALATGFLLQACASHPKQEPQRAPASRSCFEGYFLDVFGFCSPQATCPANQILSYGTCVDAKAPTSILPGAPVPLQAQVLDSPAAIVSRLNEMTTALYRTSGYANRTELIQAAETASGFAAQASKILINESLEVAMARKSERRADILKTGFLTFRQATTTTGASAARGRDFCEGNYLGLEGDSYAKMADDLKAKSAYLSPLPKSGLQSPVAVGIYGDDHYFFRLDHVRDRLSLTPGDSLNRRYGQVTEKLRADTNPILAWDQIYVPWQQRELLIAPLATGLADKKLGVHMETFRFSENEASEKDNDMQRSLVQLSFNSDKNKPVLWTSSDLVGFKPVQGLEAFDLTWDWTMDYIEAQIWGPLNLDDVAAFEFTKSPPTGDFLEALKKRKIEIRDGRPAKQKK